MEKEQSKNVQSLDADDGLWGKEYRENVPLFKGTKEVEVEKNDKSHLKDLEQIHDCEIDIIAKNPDVLGYNIDSKLIIWPERRDKISKEFKPGNEENLSQKYGISKERILEAIKEESSKEDLLNRTLAKLPEGAKFRINPHATMSAFSVANSEPIIDENGEKRYHIDDSVMAQVEKIKAKAGESDLTVVMSQIWKYKDENGKERLTSDIPKDASDYITLCKSFVEQSGYSERAGKGLVLELGNECNMSHESDGPLFKTEAFAETVDAEAYANFYFETAKALRASFPDIKLSLTGTALFDYDFTKQVVDQIQAKKDADESLKETKLIDIISFHPYRKTVESPTPFLNNGKVLSKEEVLRRSEEYWESLDNDKKDTIRQTIIGNLTEEEKTIAAGLSNEEIEGSIAYRAYANFDRQLELLREIAEQADAEVTVGEISFYAEDWGESIDENEQERNAEYGRKMGYTSLLWPGEQIVKHENPEQRRIDLEKIERRQSLTKFTRFLDDDATVKKIMLQIAPRETDWYNDNSLINYSDRLHHGIDEATSYLSRMMSEYCPSEQLERKLKEIKENAINTRISSEQLGNFYQSCIADMRPDFVKKVSNSIYGHNVLRDENMHELEKSASSINEILHLIHSYVMENEEIIQKLPIIEKNPLTNNVLYGDEDSNNNIAKELYNGLDKQTEEAIIVALKDRTLLILRDYGHASMLDISKDADDKYYINYHIPKICNLDKVNALPGVHKIDSFMDAASGEFQIENESDVSRIVLDFISQIPTDYDIKTPQIDGV